jgi:hypothetical protein
MDAMNLIAVFVENKPGQTARITRILAEAGVNIAWLTIASSGSFGVMKFLVDRIEPAMEALKAKGLMASLLEVLAVEVANHPGALQEVADLLGSHDINLANCSGFLVNSRAILIVEVQEVEQARKVLRQQGFRLFNQDEMHRL